MKSTSGEYYQGLDHIRAMAAFMVFSWHFVHIGNASVPYEYVPTFPLASLFEEGHTGVALFMTLSGYLFAKMLNGKQIIYKYFFFNRALRLLPLLVLVIFIVGLRKYFEGENIAAYAASIAKGVVMPTLPNGGWSITIEAHFYLILPLLFLISAQNHNRLLLIILAFVLLRTAIFLTTGTVQYLSYWTIIGRIDQFIFGMILSYWSPFLKGRHISALLVAIIFCIYYWMFNLAGGFYKIVQYPSPSPIWIIMPTIEGFGYAFLIAYYDETFQFSNALWARALALIGTISYSIYLIHFFFYGPMVKFIHAHIMSIDNYPTAFLWSVVGFLLTCPIAYASYRFVETPFLRFRRPYTIKSNSIQERSESLSTKTA
ncbi:acyltransferase [Xanthobacter sp. KR7-225]|uniref:acyltransferase family protein n=1 Tax=Xanthobacter sp. KR7-225 TaxID=3156613 RepID=UPI0032B3E045